MEIKNMKEGLLALPRDEKIALFDEMKKIYNIKKEATIRGDIVQIGHTRRYTLVRKSRQVILLIKAIKKNPKLGIEIVESDTIEPKAWRKK